LIHLKALAIPNLPMFQPNEIPMTASTMLVIIIGVFCVRHLCDHAGVDPAVRASDQPRAGAGRPPEKAAVLARIFSG
jgi:hypothetical protein